MGGYLDNIAAQKIESKGNKEGDFFLIGVWHHFLSKSLYLSLTSPVLISENVLNLTFAALIMP
ncbi:MAG: hypothetical protein ACI8P3_000466 [Saprospiraceae bacterium]|jgi:hypothetical protein